MFGGDGALDAIARQYGGEPRSGGEGGGSTGGGGAEEAAAFETHGPLAPDVGIVPRVLIDMMGVLALNRGSVDATVSVNYLEIYNDKITDLISGKGSRVCVCGGGYWVPHSVKLDVLS